MAAKIVLSYRHGDSPGTIGWMYEKLSTRYGEDSVFRDVDNIQPSMDFRKVIGHTLRRADLVLVIIGPKWRGPVDGKLRIDEINDWVRIEVETALQLDIPIIPVLIEGADMPKVEEVPDSLKDLTYKHAVRVEPGKDFQAHVNRLFDAMDKILSPPPDGPGHNGPPPPSPPPSLPSRSSVLGRVMLPVRFRDGDSVWLKIGKVCLLMLYYWFLLWVIVSIMQMLGRL